LTDAKHFSAFYYDAESGASNVHIESFKNTNARIFLDTLSFVTSFINTCCLLLLSKGKMSNFIWGLTAVILLGFINYICDNTGT
jgi:nicotinamide riboside transporter PnuC